MSHAAAQSARQVDRATREIVGVLLLTLGSLLLPVLGWLAGAVLLWTSQRLRGAEKLLGTLVWPGGYLPVLILFTIPTQTCSSTGVTGPGGQVTSPETCTGTALPPVLGIALLLLAVFAPIAVGIWLYRQARARANSESAPALAVP